MYKKGNERHIIEENSKDYSIYLTVQIIKAYISFIAIISLPKHFI